MLQGGSNLLEFDPTPSHSQGWKWRVTYRDFAYVLQLAANTLSDYMLVECIDNEKGDPYGPRGVIRSMAAALRVYDAYTGHVPPHWGHPIAKNDDEDMFGWTDEVIEWDADHDDGYRSDDPALYRQKTYSPSLLTARRATGVDLSEGCSQGSHKGSEEAGGKGRCEVGCPFASLIK
jgi:hypothetical protein